ncbi:MAG: hypothetical protein A2275_08290 [Bacteroidetes bacterium RIFOXYA12_FULL_35_11]|nr:MAG: hypothetical protein A2X01_18565 [Bacteroidetes bacterium GWF2_35_48]OFY73097.1 MAG: hypothetical protein A2275_08290 [Bacteroidetes bacterium RIFOXYA12_FULL_35_11]HBX53315.1 hypothetical protein [Bacteroidales bacterium]
MIQSVRNKYKHTEKKVLKPFISALVILVSFCLISSCQNDTTERISDSSDAYNEMLLDSNQAVVYTVPTPVQITSALKLLDIKYSDEFIQETKNNKTSYVSTFSKAINLGIHLVDLTYVVIYDNSQASLIYFDKIEKLTRELDLQNNRTIPVLTKCKKFITNKDSLFYTLLTLQNEMDRKLFESQKEEVSLIIIAGFYIEGLYMLTNHYEKLMKNKTFTSFYSNNLNNIIFQQKLYLESLLDLLKMYPDEDIQKLNASLVKLQKQFEELNIRYEFSDKEQRLKNVTFDKDKLVEIKNFVSSFRSSIVNDTY